MRSRCEALSVRGLRFRLRLCRRLIDPNHSRTERESIEELETALFAGSHCGYRSCHWGMMAVWEGELASSRSGLKQWSRFEDEEQSDTLMASSNRPDPRDRCHPRLRH